MTSSGWYRSIQTISRTSSPKPHRRGETGSLARPFRNMAHRIRMAHVLKQASFFTPRGACVQGCLSGPPPAKSNANKNTDPCRLVAKSKQGRGLWACANDVHIIACIGKKIFLLAVAPTKKDAFLACFLFSLVRHAFRCHRRHGAILWRRNPCPCARAPRQRLTFQSRNAQPYRRGRRLRVRVFVSSLG